MHGILRVSFLCKPAPDPALLRQVHQHRLGRAKDHGLR